MPTANDIQSDIDRYFKAMMLPNGWSICLGIERRYGLDGLTPEMVSTEMHKLLKRAERREKSLGGRHV